MSVKKGLFGAVGLSLLAAGLQLPANAQTTVAAETATETSVVSESAPVDAAILPTSEAIEDLTFNEPQIQLSDLTFSETHTQP